MTMRPGRRRSGCPASTPAITRPSTQARVLYADGIWREATVLAWHRLEVARRRDGSIGVMVGDGGAERDEVVLSGGFSPLEFLLPTLPDGAGDQEEPKQSQNNDNTGRDQYITQQVRRRAVRCR